MIPRLRPEMGWAELAAAFTLPAKDDVERFETSFAELMGQKHAIAFPYGRTGLALLLEAMGVEGREVICPAYTCVVVAHAIVASGNEPVFVDSQEADFNMNLDRVEELITEKTGAIVATSLFGYPVDLERLGQIRSRHAGIRIIQDCAHSFTASWRSRPVQKAGDAAVFGLNISKLIHSIFGGMITTDRDDLASELRRLRGRKLSEPGWSKSWRRRFYLAAASAAFAGPAYGWVHALERAGLLSRFVDYYDEAVIQMPEDYLVGLTRVEARVGQAQIARYGEIIRKRRQAAAFYDEHLRGVPGLRLPPLVEGATYSHYVPRIERREELIRFAFRHGVQLGRLIEYSIPEMTAYRAREGSRVPCPVAGQLARTAVNLPVWGSPSGWRHKVVHVIRKWSESTSKINEIAGR